MASIQRFWEERARIFGRYLKDFEGSSLRKENLAFAYRRLARSVAMGSNNDISVLKVDLWNEGVDPSRGDVRDFFTSTRNVRLYGIDLSSAICRLANERTRETVEIVCSDLRSQPFRGALFDAIFDVSTLDHLPPASLTLLVSEYSRVLKSGGALIMIFDSAVTFLWTLQEVQMRIRYHRKERNPFSPFWWPLHPWYVKNAVKRHGFKILAEYSLDILPWALGLNIISRIICRLRLGRGVQLAVRRLESSSVSKYLLPLALQYAIIAAYQPSKD